MKQKQKSVTRGFDGNRSSKRFWGSIAMGLGLGMKLGFALIALSAFIPIAELKDRITVALSASDGVLWVGGLLLGITVAERFAPWREQAPKAERKPDEEIGQGG